MSPSVDHRPIQAVLAVLVVACGTAMAQVAPPSAPGAAVRLRCWQLGKLIIDETGVPMPREPGMEVELLTLARTPSHAPLTVFVRAGTTCLAKPERPREAGFTPHSW